MMPPVRSIWTFPAATPVPAAPSVLRAFTYVATTSALLPVVAATNPTPIWFSPPAAPAPNACAILGIVFFISIIGFFQEYRAERAMMAGVGAERRGGWSSDPQMDTSERRR